MEALTCLLAAQDGARDALAKVQSLLWDLHEYWSDQKDEFYGYFDLLCSLYNDLLMRLFGKEFATAFLGKVEARQSALESLFSQFSLTISFPLYDNLAAFRLAYGDVGMEAMEAYLDDFGYEECEREEYREGLLWDCSFIRIDCASEAFPKPLRDLFFRFPEGKSVVADSDNFHVSGARFSEDERFLEIFLSPLPLDQEYGTLNAYGRYGMMWFLFLYLDIDGLYQYARKVTEGGNQ